MYWIFIALLAVPLAVYVANRLGRRSDVVPSAAPASRPRTGGRFFRFVAFVLALPLLARLAFGILVVLGLVYVYFFGPIKPIHEWMR